MVPESIGMKKVQGRMHNDFYHHKKKQFPEEKNFPKKTSFSKNTSLSKNHPSQKKQRQKILPKNTSLQQTLPQKPQGSNDFMALNLQKNHQNINGTSYGDSLLQFYSTGAATQVKRDVIVIVDMQVDYFTHGFSAERKGVIENGAWLRNTDLTEDRMKEIGTL